MSAIEIVYVPSHYVESVQIGGVSIFQRVSDSNRNSARGFSNLSVDTIHALKECADYHEVVDHTLEKLNQLINLYPWETWEEEYCTRQIPDL